MSFRRVVVLLLAGWLALAGAQAAFAESRGAGLASDHHRGPARVHFVAVTHEGRSRRGQHFTAARVRILKIDVEWRTLVGAHTQRLELIMPDGSVYQRFTSEVRSADGHATVETQVPVAGTWITDFSLEGAWEVNVYLDNAITPVATASFTLVK